MKLSKTVSLKTIGLYLASAVIPLCVMLAVMYKVKIAPFGDSTLLFVDSKTQYINYLSYFRSVLLGENDFLYTFSKNLGGDIISLAAYYLLSPFNILFVFSTLETLPLWFTAVVLLKLSLCGFTYYYASSRIYGHKFTNLAFSTCYALMAYNIVYEWNIMWLDGVLILPLLGLGLARLWKDGKWHLYAFSIAYALLTSFYIGYMLCIASVIFCAALMVIKDGTVREKIATFGKFVLASCIGGLGTAFVWLPAFLSLQGGRASSSENVMEFTSKFHFPDFASKFVAGSVSWVEIYSGMPNVFCGMLVLVLVLIFFFNKNTPVRNRMVALATVALFLVSFYYQGLDVIWHGFSPNRSFNFRYSFIFSYVLISIAHNMLQRWNTVRYREIILAVVLTTVVLTYVYFGNYEVVEIGTQISICCLVAVAFLLWLKKNEKLPAFFSLGIVGICILEMGANCWLCWDRLDHEISQLYYSDYVEFVEMAEPAIDYVKKLDTGFYRMEKTFYKDQNDPMLFTYNGLSHFSSVEKPYVMQFLERMGLKNCYYIWSYYNTGSTADVDALLGVKYVLSQYDLTESKNYELLTTINGIGIYENPNVLPIGILSNQAVKNVTLENPDYFSLHNDIWAGICGNDVDILQGETNYTVTYVNLRSVSEAQGNITYKKIDETMPALIRYEIAVSQEKPLYYYFTSSADEQKITVFVNGEDKGAYFDAYRWDMSNAGTYSCGDEVVIELALNSDQIILERAYFYYEDLTELTEASREIKENLIQMIQLSSSHIVGSFAADEAKTLMFTIPYDEGWKITLDGVQVSGNKALNTFLSVDVPSGEHTFDMVYIPRGTYVGCILSAFAIFIGILWILQEKNRAPRR